MERLVRERVRERVGDISIKFVNRDINKPSGYDFPSDGINVSCWIRRTEGPVEITLYRGSNMMRATENAPYEISCEDLMFAGVSEKNRDHVGKLESHAKKIADMIDKDALPGSGDIRVGFRPNNER